MKHETFYGILMIVLGAIALVLVPYLFTKMCTSYDDDEHNSNGSQPFPKNPVFAHELFLGTIVLQSANGEYYRIIQECSSKHKL